MEWLPRRAFESQCIGSRAAKKSYLAASGEKLMAKIPTSVAMSESQARVRRIWAGTVARTPDAIAIPRAHPLKERERQKNTRYAIPEVEWLSSGDNAKT